MHSNSATKFIEFVEKQELVPDNNFTFLENETGFYTLVKKSVNDPFRSIPVMRIMVMSKLSYIPDLDELAKVMCEHLNKKEAEYLKKNPIENDN